MAGRTGYTGVDNNAAMQGPTQITDVYKHFDALTGQSFPTVEDLPSLGNWAGRTAYVVNADAIYRHNGSQWKRNGSAGRLFSGPTDASGIIIVNHQFGSTPAWAVSTSGNASTETLNLILSPIIWAISSTTVSVRFRRNDTNQWATLQPVVGYLNVGI